MNKILILFIVVFIYTLPQQAWATNYCQDASIVGCYPAQTNSGTSLIDNSSNGNNGTFASSGHPAWVTQSPPRLYLTYGLSYLTSSDHITLPGDTTTFKPGQAQSTCFWLYPLSATFNPDSGVSRVFSKNNGAESTIAYGEVGAATGSAVQININGSTNMSVVTSNNVLTTNAWNNVCTTGDGSITAANWHIYINGSEATYQTQQNGVSLNDESAGTFYLGNNSVGTRETYGYITEISTYQRVLSSSDVTSIYTNGLLQAPISTTNMYNTKVYNASIY